MDNLFENDIYGQNGSFLGMVGISSDRNDPGTKRI